MSNVLADHASAVAGLLAGITRKFEGAVPSNPTPPPPYLVYYLHMESLPGTDGNTLNGESATITARVICHCIGSDAIAARAVAWQVRDRLLDIVPTITGRTSSQFFQESSAPPTRDETTGVLVMDQIDVYRFNSYPA